MSKYTEEQLKDIFNFFDEDGSGKIKVCELKNVFKQIYGCEEDLAQTKAEVCLPAMVFFYSSDFYWSPFIIMIESILI